jgi:hypothetical protein
MIPAFLCVNYKYIYIYKIEKKAETIVLAFLYVKLQKKTPKL